MSEISSDNSNNILVPTESTPGALFILSFCNLLFTISDVILKLHNLPFSLFSIFCLAITESQCTCSCDLNRIIFWKNYLILIVIKTARIKLANVKLLFFFRSSQNYFWKKITESETDEQWKFGGSLIWTSYAVINCDSMFVLERASKRSYRQGWQEEE